MTLTASEYHTMLEQGAQYKSKKLGLFISSFLRQHKDKRSRTLDYCDVKLVDSGSPDLPFVTHDWYDPDPKPELWCRKWEESYTIIVEYPFDGAHIDERVEAIKELLRHIPIKKTSFTVSSYTYSRVFDRYTGVELIEAKLLITAESD